MTDTTRSQGPSVRPLTPANAHREPNRDNHNAVIPISPGLYRRYERQLSGAAVLLVVLGAWQGAASLHLVPVEFTSSPWLIIQAGRTYFGGNTWLRDFAVSGQEVGFGYGLSIVIGIPAGLVMAFLPKVDAALEPLVNFVYVSPKIALAPLFVVYFGIGKESKVALIFSICVFPIFMNTLIGVKTVDKQYINVARVYGASKLRTTRDVILPSSMAAIMTGLRLGVGNALIGMVVGEFIASSSGVGHEISTAGATFNSNLLLLEVVVLSLFGVILAGAIKQLEVKFERWRT